jgi:putative ABC transport system permease protein
MKYFRLVTRHLLHNWVRTASTVIAIAACIFLFATLETVIDVMNRALMTARADRLVTRNQVSLQFPVPIPYKARIASVTGVQRVAASNWFGGIYQDRKNFFTNMAVDLEEFLDMYPEFILDPDERKDLLADMRGCVIGRALADRFGWKVGNVFQLESFIPIYRKKTPFEFVIKAIYDTDPKKHAGTDRSAMFFHWKYLYEGMERKTSIATVYSQISNPDDAVAISKTIDAMFENSDSQTRTETEAAFRASFVSMGGNLALLLHAVGLAVTFTILLVTANTMSMAVRERRTEIGILKTLGFGNGLVLLLILGEALLLGLLGGGVGILAGSGVIQVLPNVPVLGDMFRGFPGLGLSARVALLGIGMAVGIGLAAGLVPAILSYRARVTQLLRHV